jgi:HEAT repeat protein
MERRTMRLPRRPALACLAILVSVGCANYIGSTARSFLKRIEESPDPNVRHLAYRKLASPGCYDNEEQKAEAARLLSRKLAQGKEPVASRAEICRTLGELRRPEGHEALVASIGSEESLIRAEACRALGKIGHPEDAAHLTRIMTADMDNDCRIAAIDGLGALRAADPRVCVMLAEGMEHEDPAIRLASLRALRSIVGRDLGTEPKPWKDYAEKQLAAAESATGRR